MTQLTAWVAPGHTYPAHVTLQAAGHDMTHVRIIETTALDYYGAPTLLLTWTAHDHP